jgi:hypothetical protein
MSFLPTGLRFLSEGVSNMSFLAVVHLDRLEFSRCTLSSSYYWQENTVKVGIIGYASSPIQGAPEMENKHIETVLQWE